MGVVEVEVIQVEGMAEGAVVEMVREVVVRGEEEMEV